MDRFLAREDLYLFCQTWSSFLSSLQYRLLKLKSKFTYFRFACVLVFLVWCALVRYTEKRQTYDLSRAKLEYKSLLKLGALHKDDRKMLVRGGSDEFARLTGMLYRRPKLFYGDCRALFTKGCENIFSPASRTKKRRRRWNDPRRRHRRRSSSREHDASRRRHRSDRNCKRKRHKRKKNRLRRQHHRMLGKELRVNHRAQPRAVLLSPCAKQSKVSDAECLRVIVPSGRTRSSHRRADQGQRERKAVQAQQVMHENADEILSSSSRDEEEAEVGPSEQERVLAGSDSEAAEFLAQDELGDEDHSVVSPVNDSSSSSRNHPQEGPPGGVPTTPSPYRNWNNFGTAFGDGYRSPFAQAPAESSNQTSNPSDGSRMVSHHRGTTYTSQ
ncbi:unnamed protein product [Amoebophrya sp. A120]|nr:unnamed protein product [Amoebophrya sp. A120]|eukprot:GSA120T00005704001.1